MALKDKFGFLQIITGYIIQSIQYINIHNGLALSSIAENSISFANIRGKKLYAARLYVDDNIPVPINIENLRATFQHEKQADFCYYYVKNKDFQAIYVFSFNEGIVNEIASTFKVQKLKGKQIAGMLFDFVLGNDSIVDKEQYVQSQILDFDEETEEQLVDPLYYNYNDMLRQELYELQDDFEFYQIIKVKPFKKNIDFSMLGKKDLKLVFGLYVNLNRKSIDKKLQDHLNYAKLFDQNARGGVEEFITASENYHLPLAIINGYIVTNDEESARTFANTFRIEIESHRLYVQDILERTLIAQRDITYNILVDAEHVGRIANVFLRKQIEAKEAKKLDSPIDFFGKDLFNSYTNFRFRSNLNPHALIVARTGSGKSVLTQKLFSQIERLDAHTGKCDYIDRHFFRYFDVGRSAYPVMEKARSVHGEKVGFFAAEINDVKIGVFDMRRDENNRKKWEKSDLLESLSLIDMILQNVQGTETLNLPERKQIEDALSHFAQSERPNNMTFSQAIEAGHTELEEVIEGGVNRYDMLCDHLNRRGMQKFDIPVLADVISYLRNAYDSPSVSNDVKATLDSTLKKLRAVETLKVFSHFSKTEFNMRRIFYAEFDKIADEPILFTPIFWAMIRKMLRSDIAQATKIRMEKGHIPNRYYVIEEAHNFLKIPSFKTLFDVMVRQLRKYRIHLIFITQNVTDVPHDIAKNIGTKIVVYPPKEDEQNSVVNDFINHLDIQSENTMRYIFKKMKPYSALIQSHVGTFAINFEYSEEEMNLFATS